MGAAGGFGVGRACDAITSALVIRSPGPVGTIAAASSPLHLDQLAHRRPGTFEGQCGLALTRLAALDTLSRNAGGGEPGRRDKGDG